MALTLDNVAPSRICSTNNMMKEGANTFTAVEIQATQSKIENLRVVMSRK